MLGGDIYAAPVARIREILKPPPLTHVPRAPREILGIISVRGQLVTVVDLRRRLRLAEVETTRKARILLADVVGGEVMGLYVDEVLQVYRLADAEIEPRPPRRSVGRSPRPHRRHRPARPRRRSRSRGGGTSERHPGAPRGRTGHVRDQRSGPRP